MATPQVNLVWLTPPGIMTVDPILRLDPRTMSRANPLQPSIDNTYDESDKMDYEDMTNKQKKKYNNKKVEQEWDRQMITMHQLDMIVPPFWKVIPHYGNYKQDNTLCKMLFKQFYVSQRNNVVYHQIHQGAQVMHNNRNTPMGERGLVTQRFDKASLLHSLGRSNASSNSFMTTTAHIMIMC